MEYQFTLEPGDLGNGFRLNRPLIGTKHIIPGSSMGSEVLYRIRVAGYDFEGMGLSDDKARANLRNHLVGVYNNLERSREVGRLSREDETCREELSDLLTANSQ